MTVIQIMCQNDITLLMGIQGAYSTEVAILAPVNEKSAMKSNQNYLDAKA